ncbi:MULTISPECIES: Re/Si-specific NAD(P)(+) transhydrogenase subunit alpha [Leptospira]|uniref:NAD(P) transhydrogenase subunit alpha part 1 n=2 Tax=Leptospira TaxID=171 RepID=A0AAW5UXK7_9LEPT|nr:MULTISPECIES: Re/Si-specific NAD(P)(+) transhydrogenase subunit alpha [Leptospira]MBL0953804.1 Re/Si-specific NAD(P)(+) transhydrogenase subunit alpha [Leptospira sp.]MCW7460817.1 Re/Si-specific NAD(P)(+) transhydrogenase subunit alpha [Leptospira limi]MCW7465675.1 Re/Si-specific NAD(P)(+) transhydrogenase subunit alpha [Leptospira levettii]MCW7510414.1 Re/Si-specific NAD(P)(+) transhydrogenase subunit alpha [Leptospira levettii]MCW7514166.1 Re/Si-specific NAD(P)(+) transhydrogenase subunit
MKIGVIKEPSYENRVAITPDVIDPLKKLGFSVAIETTAGDSAFFSDQDYKDVGATVESRDSILSGSDIVVSIHALDEASAKKIGKDKMYIATLSPLAFPKKVKEIAAASFKIFSMDTIPRITRAQSMDVLSSQATVSGYKAVLLAASNYSRFFPMLTTAAGTITPARVLILGAGVAGLQAIATSRRLGAVVDVFDTRPEVKEQCMSLGAKFVEVEGAADASNTGGYAVEQSEDYQRRQKEAIAKFAEKADIIITTALIPGKRAPLLITKEMVDKMRQGSVIVDLAAVNGGNCELTENDKTIVYKGITIIGNSNLQSTQPMDASKMYAKNIVNFLKLFVNKEKQFNINLEDEIINACMIAENGSIRHKPTLALLGE